jgi:hypothetical protein
VSHYAGKSVTKDSLKEDLKTLEVSKSLPDKFVNEAIELGFADEEGKKITPIVPRTLMSLMRQLDLGNIDKKSIENHFGDTANFLLDCAKRLSLFREEEDLIIKLDLNSEYQRLIPYIESCQNLMRNKDISRSQGVKSCSLLLSAIKQVSLIGNDIAKLIVYSMAIELLPIIVPSLNKMVKQNVMSPVTEITDRLEQNAVKSSREKDLNQSSSGIHASTIPKENISKTEQTTPAESLDKKITAYLSDGKRITLSELTEKINEMGFNRDIKTELMRMLLKGQLKVSL